MAIDYSRPKPNKPEPPPAQPSPPAPASGLPSWYRPPEEDEASAAPAAPPPQAPRPAAPVAPAAPATQAAPAAGLPSWYRPPEDDEVSSSPAAPPAPAPPAAPPPAYPVAPSGYPAPTAPSAPTPPPAQPGYPQPGYPAPGNATPGYSQPGYPQLGSALPGYPAPVSPSPAGPPPVWGAPSGYQPTASLAGPGQSPGAISLQKVTLTAASPHVSLTKSGGGTGTIRINLNWSQGAPKSAATGGFFKRLTAPVSSGVDLDLGCLYELSDGSKGVVQALGNSFGSLDSPPWIKLDGDDRTGSVTTGENMSINLDQPGRFRRVLIFAMIYEGAANWAAVDGVVTLSPINGPQIEVRLDATDQSARICAVAQLINNGGDLVVQREVQYINGSQSVLDRTYNWGMNWTPGRK